MANILVIDDDELSLMLYRTVLEQKNHTTVEAGGGLEGVALFKEHKIDVVITDIFMEDKDGLEVIEELIRLDPTVKIVAITGAKSDKPGAPDYLEMARECGARQIMAKPVDWKVMLNMIDDLLAEP